MKLFRAFVILFVTLFVMLASCTDDEAFDLDLTTTYSPGLAVPLGMYDPSDTLQSIIENYVLPLDSTIPDCVQVFMEDADFEYKFISKDEFNLEDFFPLPFELETYADQADNIEYITFYLNATNGYPLPIQFNVTTSDGSSDLQTLFDVGVPSGKVKNEVVESAESIRSSVTFRGNEIDDFFNVTRIVVDSEVVFTEESLDILRLKKDYTLKAQVALKIKFNLITDSLQNLPF